MVRPGFEPRCWATLEKLLLEVLEITRIRNSDGRLQLVIYQVKQVIQTTLPRARDSAGTCVQELNLTPEIRY